jgi:hypothetical protein
MRTWTRITEQIPAALQTEYLAALFRHLLKPDLTYDQFMESYHLYLQQIPLPTAAEAWGINQATTHLQTKPTS